METLDIDPLVTCIYDQLTGKSSEIRRLIEKYELKAVLEVVLWIDTNQEESAPALGFDDKVISFLHQVGAVIDIDMYRFHSRQENK